MFKPYAAADGRMVMDVYVNAYEVESGGTSTVYAYAPWGEKQKWFPLIADGMARPGAVCVTLFPWDVLSTLDDDAAARRFGGDGMSVRRRVVALTVEASDGAVAFVAGARSGNMHTLHGTVDVVDGDGHAARIVRCAEAMRDGIDEACRRYCDSIADAPLAAGDRGYGDVPVRADAALTDDAGEPVLPARKRGLRDRMLVRSTPTKAARSQLSNVAYGAFTWIGAETLDAEELHGFYAPCARKVSRLLGKQVPLRVSERCEDAVAVVRALSSLVDSGDLDAFADCYSTRARGFMREGPHPLASIPYKASAAVSRGIAEGSLSLDEHDAMNLTAYMFGPLGAANGVFHGGGESEERAYDGFDGLLGCVRSVGSAWEKVLDSLCSEWSAYVPSRRSETRLFALASHVVDTGDGCRWDELARDVRDAGGKRVLGELLMLLSSDEYGRTYGYLEDADYEPPVRPAEPDDEPDAQGDGYGYDCYYDDYGYDDDCRDYADYQWVEYVKLFRGVLPLVGDSARGELIRSFGGLLRFVDADTGEELPGVSDAYDGDELKPGHEAPGSAHGDGGGESPGE